MHAGLKCSLSTLQESSIECFLLINKSYYLGESKYLSWTEQRNLKIDEQWPQDAPKIDVAAEKAKSITGRAPLKRVENWRAPSLILPPIHKKCC
jgi:hypothetical protein